MDLNSQILNIPTEFNIDLSNVQVFNLLKQALVDCLAEVMSIDRKIELIQIEEMEHSILIRAFLDRDWEGDPFLESIRWVCLDCDELDCIDHTPSA